MTHLTMDALVQLREPGIEPGSQAAREHLQACPQCRQELDRLHQRVARLKALPALRPTRDLWPVIRVRQQAERRRHRNRWMGLGGLVLAASVVLTLIARDLSTAGPVDASSSEAIVRAMERSSELEQTLDSYRPESRVTDGLTARVAGELEDRIAAIDQQLEIAQLLDRAERDAALLKLWQERVGLLDALVDVHLTRASNVGL